MPSQCGEALKVFKPFAILTSTLLHFFVYAYAYAFMRSLKTQPFLFLLPIKEPERGAWGISYVCGF